MKITITLILKLICITSFSQYNNIILITTFYKKGVGVNTSMELSLSKDKKFIEETKALSCTDRKRSTNKIEGTYKIDQNKLILTPQRLSFFDFNGIHTELEGVDTIIKNSQFISTYYIINYNNVILLFQEGNKNYLNDFIEISNKINEKNNIIEIDNIWKNMNNSIKVGNDLSKNFPDTWKDYILTKPLNGKIINSRIIKTEERVKYSLQDDNSKYLYELNIGLKDGIRKGMKLYPITKNSNSCELIIIETFSNTSKGYIRAYQEIDCKSYTEYSSKREY